jgi:hypothetical protein
MRRLGLQNAPGQPMFQAHDPAPPGAVDRAGNPTKYR